MKKKKKILNQGDETNLIAYNGHKYVQYVYKTIGLSNFITPFSPTIIDYLIVAGGGGCVIFSFNQIITFGLYPLYIGKSGDGGYGQDSANGKNGENSSFWEEVSIGGGGGWSYSIPCS